MITPKKQVLFQSVSFFRITLLLGLIVWLCGLPLAPAGAVGSNSCAQPTFGNLIPYNTKNLALAGPPRVAVGDFNGDGFADVARTGRSDLASVQILLRDGQGNFGETAGSPFPVGRFPNQLAAADFNGDGKDDLAIANAVLAGEVRLLLSDGAGNFHNAPGSPVELQVNAVSLGVADFNGDGKFDLVVGHADVSFASILLGDGAGGFTKGVLPSVASSGEVAVRVGDFNRDGNADFAAVDLVSGKVTIQLGQGDGTFNNAPGSPFNAGAFATAVVSADFNRDGKSDLAITNSASSTVKLWLGQGNGDFLPERSVSVANRPVAIETGDFNFDGKPDIAVATERSGASVLLGDGEGGFFGRTDYPEGGTLAVKDTNLDGKPDLVFASGVRLNTCSSGCDQPSFDAPRAIAISENPFRLTSEDFNRDGKPDLAVTNAGNGNVTPLLGDGAGSFNLGPPPFWTVVNGAQPIVSGDFNGDGIPDLAVGQFLAFPNGAVQILRGLGDGGFAPSATFGVRWGVASLVVADFNGDGRQDLAAGLADTNIIPIFLGTMDGQLARSTDAQVNLGEGTFFLATGDFNGDGKPDLVVTNGVGDETHISVLFGDGRGRFSAPIKFSVGGTGAIPNWIVVADFNRDGKADVATANVGDDTISMLLGNGAGGFNAPLRFGVQGGVTMLSVADFNLDGNLDLAVRYRRQGIAGIFGIFLGKGDGGFGEQIKYFDGDFPAFLGAADINRDGKPDIVTANYNENTVSVLLNSCTPTNADLSLRKTVAAESVQTGANVTWAIKVKNHGPGEARSVVVSDTLDNRTAFVNCTATNGGVCDGSGNNRTVTFAALPAGVEATITLTARLNCAVADGTRIPNTATVKATTPDPELENNSARAVIRASNPRPKITGITVDKPVLWPPNHKLVDVTVNYKVTDNCDSPSAIYCQLSVKSNERVDPANPDWVIVDAHHVKLRAERKGNGKGRIYTITITCTDRSGNANAACTTVKVPKSRGD